MKVHLKFVFTVCIQYPDKWHRKECFKSWSSQVKVHQYKLLDHLHNLGPLCRRAAGWTFSRCLNMVKHKHKHDMIVSDNLNKSYKYIGTGLLKKRLYKELSNPSPKSPKSPIGTGVPLKSHRPPPPPITFNHEGVLKAMTHPTHPGR